MPFGQLGFRIEQVDMARTAIHEQKDHRFRFGSEMGSAWREGIARGGGCRRCLSGGQTIMGEERLERKRAKTGAASLQQFAT